MAAGAGIPTHDYYSPISGFVEGSADGVTITKQCTVMSTRDAKKVLSDTHRSMSMSAKRFSMAHIMVVPKHAPCSPYARATHLSAIPRAN